MFVISAPGTQCPKDREPRQYIDDRNPVEVPESAFYLRLVADGSLLIAPSPVAPMQKPAREKRTEEVGGAA